jgi:hypothetical protein
MVKTIAIPMIAINAGEPEGEQENEGEATYIYNDFFCDVASTLMPRAFDSP